MKMPRETLCAAAILAASCAYAGRSYYQYEMAENETFELTLDNVTNTFYTAAGAARGHIFVAESGCTVKFLPGAAPDGVATIYASFLASKGDLTLDLSALSDYSEVWLRGSVRSDGEKTDTIGEPPPEFYEFYKLALGDPIAVSALHGHGTGELLDTCYAHFPEADPEPAPEDGVIRVAVIGKPNAGKSSLVNRILGTERVIVSDVAGTTRDAVDTPFENETGRYVFIDTAGMRRQARVDEPIEKYSVMRAMQAVERADVCLILIDAQDGVTEQDTKVAGFAHESGKASVIVVNKWDLVSKETKTMADYEAKVRTGLSYMTYAPVAFISALTGQRVEKLFPLIRAAYEQSCLRIATGQLNDILRDAVARVQPPTDRGRRLPHFVLFCNDIELFHYSYRRYIENRIREVFGSTGTPIRMTIRQKGDE